MIGSSPRSDPYVVQFNPPRNVPTGQRRYWRWADADGSFGVSTQPNNKARPMKTNGFYLPPDKTIEGNNCGANDEAFSLPSRRSQRPDGRWQREVHQGHHQHRHLA